MKFKLINSKNLSFVFLFICCFFVGCSSGVKVQTIKDTTKTKETPDILREQLDQGLANAITYFEEHFASIENDQVVMSLELLSQEFQLGMNLPNIWHHVF